MNLIHFNRLEDVSGVSQTGHVADAVEFDDGTVIVHWRSGPHGSATVYANSEDMKKIHGHDGKTEFVSHPIGPYISCLACSES